MMNNATQIVESLDPDEIRQRLEQLTREQYALRVLLRAASRVDQRRQKSLTQAAKSTAAEAQR